MKKSNFTHVGCCLALSLFILSCQTEPPGPWEDFMKCGTNACVKEVLAVKDAFLKDPKSLLVKFDEAGQRGEDHFIGWLYILRDSVLLHQGFGSTEARFALQQAIVEAASPFQNDPKYGELARSIADEIGMLAIASELEDASGDYAPITGTYSFELPNDAGTGELKTSRSGSESMRFELLVVGGPPAHNQGMMQGTAKLTSMNVFQYETNEFGGTCRLLFTFDGEAVELKTLQGDAAACGFGNAVSADNVYRMTSYDDPFLTGADAKTAKNLQGRWQSVQDEKMHLHIESGRYISSYDGQDQENLPYQFYPKCPKDCNPVTDVPCIAVMGQDDVCYTVVKADGKTLELSMIGGTGNTLVFKRM